MKKFDLFRWSVFTICFVLLALVTQSVAALPAPPVPVSPSGGSTIIIPTFTWLASTGAVSYEVEVGPQSDPLVVYWSAQTVNLTLTPNDAFKFTNIPLYWRVRDVASATWSSKINFTKHIPAPTQVSPANSTSVVTPTLVWQTVQGAAYYQVELSTSNTFIPVEATYSTYNTQVTPESTLAHGTHYWRVTGADADGHLGTPSAGWSFVKDIPFPTLLSPANNHTNIHTPSLQWSVVDGAAYYKVELSTSSTFIPVDDTYTTYNTRLTPEDAITRGLHYWRVSSVDADGHVGTPSSGWSFTKTTDAPPLYNPDVNATITVPTMEWGAVAGAAYYKVELSLFNTFTPIFDTFTTYNLSLTPIASLSLNTYYWRVSGVDAAGNVGLINWRRFTLNAQSDATDVTPQLSTPTASQTIFADPTFSWTRVVGAAEYRLIVSRDASLSPIYDQVISTYNSYTPNSAGSYEAYPNGIYYWKVEARNGSHTVIASSSTYSFTKTEIFLLSAPANGATGLLVDPTFEWNRIVGAKTYRLIVSKDPSLSPIYDQVVCDYTSYTPYTAGSYNAYPNDIYYWKVEARNSGGTVIVTSESRSLTKLEVLPLVSPTNGATGLLVDPTFEWSRIVGAKTYHLIISRDASLSPIYDQVTVDYTSYTPYDAGSYNAYPNGTYYWKVEARNSGGTIITTSEARSLTKQEPLVLIAPVNSAKFTVTPTFQWSQIIGAKTYHLIVSREADQSPIYDQVFSDYTSYTPYTAGSFMSYPDDFYFWHIEARNSGNTVIAKSNVWNFIIGESHLLFLPVTLKNP